MPARPNDCEPQVSDPGTPAAPRPRLRAPGGFAILLLSTGAARAEFVLSSPDLVPDEMMMQAQVLNDFGCHGQNRSPALTWRGAPSGTKSFALTLYDPDAPTGSGFWHWLVVNIPATVDGLPGGVKAGQLPGASLQGRNDFGTLGYGGPCPPAGDPPHHYQFTVFALDVARLPVDPTSPGALVGVKLHAHALAKATLTTKFGR